MIKIACAGFPVGQQKYQTIFPTVELSQMFERMPRLATLKKWREEATQYFEYIVCAPKVITMSSRPKAQKSHHQSSNTLAFKDSAVLRQALQQTLNAAETLRSRLVFFQLSPALAPTADNIKTVHDFFERTKQGHSIFTWEPPVSWPFSLVESLSNELRVMPVYNPLRKGTKAFDVPMRYFRLGADGRTSGSQRLTDEELHQVQVACDLPLCYVVFNNGPTAYEDALRFQAIVPLSNR